MPDFTRPDGPNLVDRRSEALASIEKLNCFMLTVAMAAIAYIQPLGVLLAVIFTFVGFYLLHHIAPAKDDVPEGPGGLDILKVLHEKDGIVSMMALQTLPVLAASSFLW